MHIGYVFLFLSIIIVVLIEIYFYKICVKVTKKESSVVKLQSFTKQMPGGLPVVSFLHKGKQVLFIIDTGSNRSFIASKYWDRFDKIKEDITYQTTVNGNGISTTSGKGVIVLTDNYGEEYKVTFCNSSGIEATLSTVDSIMGCTVYGLLGVDFLQKYSLILNFDHLNLYKQI